MESTNFFSVICLCLWLSNGSDNEYVYCYMQFTEYFKKIIRLLLTAVLELIVILVFSVLNLVLFPCGIVENLEKFIDLL